MNKCWSSVLSYLSGFVQQSFLSQPKFSVRGIRTVCMQRYAYALSTLVVAVVAALAISSSAFAQVRFGTILGTVADSSGATVSGASIKLTNLGTNESRTVQTNAGGLYTFPNLTAGLYRVDVEISGFKHFTQDKIEVQVDV